MNKTEKTILELLNRIYYNDSSKALRDDLMTIDWYEGQDIWIDSEGNVIISADNGILNLSEYLNIRP